MGIMVGHSFWGASLYRIFFQKIIFNYFNLFFSFHFISFFSFHFIFFKNIFLEKIIPKGGLPKHIPYPLFLTSIITITITFFYTLTYNWSTPNN